MVQVAAGRVTARAAAAMGAVDAMLGLAREDWEAEEMVVRLVTMADTEAMAEGAQEAAVVKVEEGMPEPHTGKCAGRSEWCRCRPGCMGHLTGSNFRYDRWALGCHPHHRTLRR